MNRRINGYSLLELTIIIGIAIIMITITRPHIENTIQGIKSIVNNVKTEEMMNMANVFK